MKARSLSGAFGAAALMLLSSSLLAAQLAFTPSEPAHAAAAAEYAKLWAAEGDSILLALEERACAPIPGEVINVTIEEASSYSGDANAPMRLRASYPEPIKRGTLVHELGHRLLPPSAIDAAGLSSHQALNLLLLQVWDDLWGPAFVRQQIAAERRWTHRYRRAWDWALSLTEEESEAKWRAVLAASGRPTLCSRRPRGTCFTQPDRCRPAED